MKNLKGKFIVFEGIDGSGKSTQAKKLGEYLRSKSYPILLTREPGGYNMREIILDLIEKKASERRIGFTFTCERALHLQYVIEPALKEGKTVISDRYFYSTAVYQGVSMPMKEVLELNKKWAEVRIPDLVLFVDIKPEEAIARAQKRGKMERYEQLDFQKKLYKNFHELAKEMKEIRIIDGSGSEEEVFEKVLGVLKSEGLL